MPEEMIIKFAQPTTKQLATLTLKAIGINLAMAGVVLGAGTVASHAYEKFTDFRRNRRAKKNQ